MIRPNTLPDEMSKFRKHLTALPVSSPAGIPEPMEKVHVTYRDRPLRSNRTSLCTHNGA